MPDSPNSIIETITLVRDIIFIVAAPVVLIIAIGLYRQLVVNLRAEIEKLKILQYDNALSIINGQKELFTNEIETLKRTIAELEKADVEKSNELAAAKQQLARREKQIVRLDESKEVVAKEVVAREPPLVGHPVRGKSWSASLEREALRKLSVWCKSDDFGKSDHIIEDYLFSSTTYGAVGVSPIEKLIMVSNGWLEEIGRDVRITKEGRETATREIRP